MSAGYEEVRTAGVVSLNNLIRFALELAMLAALAYTGWHVNADRWVQILLAALFPVTAAILWTVFRTPGDQSAGKAGLIATPGPVRLAIELGLFLIASLGLWWSGERIAAETLLTFAGLHYILCWQRLRWLVHQR